MQVRLVAFASAAEALGGSERLLELPGGATVADLRRELLARHPGLAAVWPRLAVAVDGTLARPESPLRDGAEVALLPPVSGGDHLPARVTATPLVADEVIAQVSGTGRGAVVLFVGTVRDEHRGRRVSGLVYTAYRPMAEARLAAIEAELAAAAPGVAVAIRHRVGELAVGEASVVIATAAPHREAAYAVNREALERLKREVPIWKRERYADGGEEWREEEPLELGPPAPAAAPIG